MPTVSVRFSQDEFEELRSKALVAGSTMSGVIKATLFPREADDGVLRDHERRLARLEEMAGL